MTVEAPPSRRARRAARNFYARALTEAERRDLVAASDVEGLDDEVALLRLKLLAALKADPGKFDLMLKGIELLTRAVATRYRLSRGSTDQLIESIRTVLQETQSLTREAGNERSR